MNKTKRIFVALIMALVTMTSAMFAGCSVGTNEPKPLHVHSLTNVTPMAATCLEDGNREYYTCSGCDGAFADAEGRVTLSTNQYVIPAKGHKILKHGEKKASCTSVGTKEHYECRNCGTLFRDANGMFEINEPGKTPVFSHSLTKVERKEAVGFMPGWEEHYACANCNTLYKDAAGQIETTLEEVKIAPTLTDFEYKIAFTPAANIESINGTGGAEYICAEYTTAENGLPATQYTLKAGAKANMEVEAWIHSVVSQTMANGQNLRIPTFNGVARKMEMIVKNDGAQDVSFRYYAENYGDKGGVDVTIAAGATETVTFEVKPGASIGCNYAFKLLSDVAEETKLTMYGYFYCEGEVDSISLYRDADKKNFKVGDSFTLDGMVVKAKGASYDEVVIANYMTDLEEGYVFTAEDIGTKTVTVAYGEYTTSYQITITA